MKWDSKTKEIVAYVFAAFSLLGGFGLTIAGFIVDPTGQIHDSVLWVLAQALTFAGAICGIGIYVNNTAKNIKASVLSSLKSYIKKENNSDDNDQDVEKGQDV